MKTTFSRTFSTTVIILLLALILVGTSFQVLVEDYLAESAIEELKQTSQAMANLASAYSAEGPMMNRDFMVNLDVTAQISGTDLIICNSLGRVILCSDALMGCEHQGLTINESYLNKVIENNGDTATGVIQGLYKDTRYVVSVPILNDSGTVTSGPSFSWRITSSPSWLTNQSMPQGAPLMSTLGGS